MSYYEEELDEELAEELDEEVDDYGDDAYEEEVGRDQHHSYYAYHAHHTHHAQRATPNRSNQEEYGDEDFVDEFADEVSIRLPLGYLRLRSTTSRPHLDSRCLPPSSNVCNPSNYFTPQPLSQGRGAALCPCAEAAQASGEGQTAGAGEGSTSRGGGGGGR